VIIVDTNYVLQELGISKDQIECVILTGGRRFCTDGVHHDTDYLIFVRGLKEGYKYINKDKICYFCWDTDKFKEELNTSYTNNIKSNLFFGTLSLIDCDRYTLYGRCSKELKFSKMEILSFYKALTKRYLESKPGFKVVGKVYIDKQIWMYLLTAMYYYKNNSPSVTPEQQELINNAHHNKVPDWLVTEVENFYNIRIWYRK
jgi:hypothetical protein